MKSARLIYDFPEKNADLYYATKFLAPDVVLFFETNGEKFLVLGDLEIDRAKRESKVNHVLSLNPFAVRASKKESSPSVAAVIHEVLLEYKISRLEVPASTSFALVDELRKRGYTVDPGPTPFYQERFAKSEQEKRFITEAQENVFAAIAMTRDVLVQSKIDGNSLVYEGVKLTSELVHKRIRLFLLERGFLSVESIVSCCEHAIDPHDFGSGPLYPNEAIIVDIFGKSSTQYCGDATRTFCKGRATDALKKMYKTVCDAQELAISKVKADFCGKEIHFDVLKFFEERGYKTGEKDGRNQGFFHGTGHSIGLEVHEEPLRINKLDHTLRVGNVMSVEPGLYYKDIGGVRIEDLIYVTKSGCEVLSGFPKGLEV